MVLSMLFGLILGLILAIIVIGACVYGMVVHIVPAEEVEMFVREIRIALRRYNRRKTKKS